MDNALYILASVIVPFITGCIVLYYFITAYRHTKMRAFANLVLACSLGLIGSLLLFITRNPDAHLSQDARHSLWVFWCVGYMMSALLSTYGMVLIIRHVISNKNVAHDT